MGTGQILAAIIAIVLLGILALGVNSIILNKTIDALETQAQIIATSIAESYLNEACSKAFDENVAPPKPNYDDPSYFSTTLGPEGETYPAYDDVDDFNGFQIDDSTSTMGKFHVVMSVSYGSETNPDQPVSGVRTHFKIVTATVSHPNLRSPITLRRIAVKHH